MGCARFPPQKIVFRSNQGAMDMEKYVHWENEALFKKRPAEAHSDLVVLYHSLLRSSV